MILNDNILSDIIIIGMTAVYKPQPFLEVKAAGYFFFDFLTTGFLQGRAVNPTPNSQPGGPGIRICDPRRQDDPAIPPGTEYPLFAFYYTHELRWDYSYPPVTTRRCSFRCNGTFSRPARHNERIAYFPRAAGLRWLRTPLMFPLSEGGLLAKQYGELTDISIDTGLRRIYTNVSVTNCCVLLEEKLQHI
jgi:hypothetical protein